MAVWFQDRLNLAFLSVSVGMVALFFYKTHVVMDDAFIYFRVAENFVAGHGLVLNAGDSHLAVTSPLWTFLLVVLAVVVGHGGLVAAAKVLYVLCLGIAGFFAYEIVRPKFGFWAVFAPAAVFFNFVVLTAVGGEIALVLVALTGVPWAYLYKRNMFWTGILLGVGYLARGELALMVVPLAAYHIWNAWRQDQPIRDTFVDLLWLSGGALGPVFCWHLYYYISFSSIFPNTFNAKMVQGRSGQWLPYALDFTNQAQLAVRGQLIFFGFVIVGIATLPAVAFMTLGYLSLHFVAYQWLTIPNYHWYYYDLHFLVLFFALMGVAGLFLQAQKYFPEKRWQSLWQVVGGVSLCVVFVLSTSAHRWKWPDPIEERYISYVRIADYLNEHARNGETLLAGEIGIVSFLAPHVVIRDVNGLATPGVTEQTINNWDHFLKFYRPRFLMLHRGFWPYGVSITSDQGVLRYVRVAEGNPQAERDKRTLLELRP